jgi:tRNA (cmo5U34)-methyltransferase
VGLPGNAEEMAAFFDRRVEGYEDHMAEHVEDFDAFYESAVAAIPESPGGPRILDLGIGTGLLLDRLFARFPDADVTGIDISRGMLDALMGKERPWHRRVRAIHGSFLETDLGIATYDTVVSVMSLHHWVPAVKLDLYRRILYAIIPGGVFVNADYVACDEESERRLAAYAAAGHDDRHTRHIDLPLPIEAERRLLAEVGFTSVAVVFERAHCAAIVSSTG